MRGQLKTTKSLTLSGNVYLHHHHTEEIANPKKGDVYLYLNDDKALYPVIMSDYRIKGYKGYFKIKIYDGNIWCLLNSLDFFEDRLHQFSKHEISFYIYSLCQERLQEYSQTTVYRTYRDHYTIQKHVPGEYKGKKTIKHQ